MKLEHKVQWEELLDQLYIETAGPGYGSADFDPPDASSVPWRLPLRQNTESRFDDGASRSRPDGL